MRVDFYFQLSFYILDSQFCFDDSEKDYAVRCVLVNDSLRDENGTLGVIFLLLLSPSRYTRNLVLQCMSVFQVPSQFRVDLFKVEISEYEVSRGNTEESCQKKKNN
jgi:hypothetical protein